MTTTDKIFRTKTGHCHILEDKLIFSKNGSAEQAAQEKAGDKMATTLILYSLGGLYCAFCSFNQLTKQNYDMDENYIVAASYALGALGCIISVLTRLNHSSARVIERKSIQTVKFKKGISWLTPPWFDVYFTTPSGKKKKRQIILPGSLSGRKHDSEEALRIMTSEKLVTEFKQS